MFNLQFADLILLLFVSLILLGKDKAVEVYRHRFAKQTQNPGRAHQETTTESQAVV